MNIEAGKFYKVHHSRKGIFHLAVDSIDGEWITGTIIAGKAKAMLDYNEREKGEQITIRESFCTFTPII